MSATTYLSAKDCLQHQVEPVMAAATRQTASPVRHHANSASTRVPDSGPKTPHAGATILRVGVGAVGAVGARHARRRKPDGMAPAPLPNTYRHGAHREILRLTRGGRKGRIELARAAWRSRAVSRIGPDACLQAASLTRRRSGMNSAPDGPQARGGGLYRSRQCVAHHAQPLT